MSRDEREILPLKCWPPGQPPWSPQPEWGPAPLGTTVERGLYWKPTAVDGYSPHLNRVSLRAVNASTNLYDETVAPSWLVSFLDENDDTTPTKANQDYDLAVATPVPSTNQLSSEPLFWEGAGVFAVVGVNNFGKGWPWPERVPGTYAPMWIAARRISDNTIARVQFAITYKPNRIGERAFDVLVKAVGA